MEALNSRLPTGYASMGRFMLVGLLTIFLAPSFAFIAMAVGTRAQSEVLEFIADLPVFWILQLFVGWVFWLPTAIIALVIGWPIWMYCLKRLSDQGWHPRVSVFASSVIVVISTTTVSGCVLIVLHDNLGANFWSLQTAFGLSATFVASAATQLLYGFD